MANRQGNQPESSQQMTTIRRDAHFAVIPEWVIFHPDLSAQAVRLYAVLARYADGDGYSHYKRASLAEALGVSSTRTVDRAAAELETAGALTIEARYDHTGDRTSNGYTVHNSPVTDTPVAPETDPVETPGGGDKFVTTPSQECRHGGDTDCSAGERKSFEVPPTPQPLTRPGESKPCPKHPNGEGRNCRACGTTPRAMAAAAERDRRAAEAEQRRRDAAARAAEREQRHRDPEVAKRGGAAVRAAIAEARGGAA